MKAIKVMWLGWLFMALTVMLMPSVVLAAPPVEGTIDVQFNGNNYHFEVYTQLNSVPLDVFRGQANGSLSAWQLVRTVPSGAYTYDADDIDRYGTFTGVGWLDVYSEYKHEIGWSPGNYDGHSELYAWANSDTAGWLGQQVHFDGTGGVKDVDAWKKQRIMELDAGGSYDLGFEAHNLLAGQQDWDFYFRALDTTGTDHGHLLGDPAYATCQRSAHDQWFHPDSFFVDYRFDWTGSQPGIQNPYYGEYELETNPAHLGHWNAIGTIIVQIDTVNKWMTGVGELW